jgi:predicted enzyme related to lactoylglutathione lyase
MLDLPKPGAVLFAKDLPRLAKFYEGVAGLSVAHSEPEVIVLESSHQQLVLHCIPPRVAQTIEISSPPKLRTDTAVKLVFAVASICEARANAAAFGGGVNPKKKEFEARGFRACDGYDPEGNVIQFREHVL